MVKLIFLGIATIIFLILTMLLKTKEIRYCFAFLTNMMYIPLIFFALECCNLSLDVRFLFTLFSEPFIAFLLVREIESDNYYVSKDLKNKLDDFILI